MMDIDKQEKSTAEVIKKPLEQEFDKARFLNGYEDDSSEIGNISELQKELEKIEEEFSQNLYADSSDSETEYLDSDSDNKDITSHAEIIKNMIESQTEEILDSKLNKTE